MTLFRWLRRLLSGPAAVLARPGPERAPVAGAAAHDGAAGVPHTAMRSHPAAAARAGAAPVSFEQLERIDCEWNAWLFDYPEHTGLALNDAETRVLDALAAILASQQPGAALVRRMPGLAPQLLHSLRSAHSPGNALARTISPDAVLAAAVIRLANSCRQGAGSAIASLDHAVILVGQEGLRQLATSAAFRPVIDGNSGLYTRRMAPRLWEHAERCAASARQLAPEMGVAPFDAFLAGLLQNTGQILALRIMDQVARGERRLGAEPFLVQLARDARALSCGIAREWHFPDTVAQALQEQGEAQERGSPQRGAPMSPLGRLLKLTGYLGKVRLLVEGGLLDESDATLFTGLAPNAARCYSALAASREPSPGN